MSWKIYDIMSEYSHRWTACKYLIVKTQRKEKLYNKLSTKLKPNVDKKQLINRINTDATRDTIYEKMKNQTI